MPLFISSLQERVSTLNNALLYFSDPHKWYAEDSIVQIKIKEDGKFQSDKLKDKLHYKNSYKIKDTLIVDKKSYQIDSIDQEWRYAYLHPLAALSTPQLPEQYIQALLPYFTKAKDKMVIDFWGTWCAPCIASMPQMKALYERTGKDVDFLSICVDDAKNLALSKTIASAHGIQWPQLFNERKIESPNITHYLEVNCFPTYMIVDRKGNIIFSNCGIEGFNELQQILMSKSY
ncbi:Thioredoxin-like [Chitinophaga costaii]|uniref:Thioredoxin-like n=1 Tax=Chitinophaga costaii TaxID=1335309 RepID=A0A1C4FXY5_9BACT|nr:TlpA family protein disulfide reductase [Chitinophaga costaii]PUZ20888.1 hypothetical protein DCM91_17285 [Chitinophaga costaii]SCC60553.1 Thioredoxin-like [Chitinophaga costaii]